MSLSRLLWMFGISSRLNLLLDKLYVYYLDLLRIVWFRSHWRRLCCSFLLNNLARTIVLGKALLVSILGGSRLGAFETFQSENLFGLVIFVRGRRWRYGLRLMCCGSLHWLKRLKIKACTWIHYGQVPALTLWKYRAQIKRLDLYIHLLWLPFFWNVRDFFPYITS